MPKRRVPEVVPEADRLHKLGRYAIALGKRPTDLRDLNRVSYPRPQEVRPTWGEDLSLALQSPEGDAVDYARAVALEG
jgi:hypothetical protein